MEQGNTPAAPQPVPEGKKNTAMAIIAYIIFFIPLLTGDAKKDPFVKFHVKQGLVLFILSAILWIIRAVLPWYWYWQLSWLFSLVSLVILVLVIVGIVNAANGKQEPLPVVGKFSDTFKF